MTEIGGWLIVAALLLLVPWALVLSLLAYNLVQLPRLPLLSIEVERAQLRESLGNWIAWGAGPVLLLVLGIILDAAS